ncbi:MAG: aspartyl/asparaginyl beta-hydroxylase domain-containing protein [Sphingorhabdus sp.]
MTSADLERQADSMAAARDFSTARALLVEVTRQRPDNFAAWMKLAAMANAMGDAPASLDAANGALAIQPMDFTALLMRAMQLHALERFDEAGDGYGRALAQLPGTYPPQMKPAIDIARQRYRDWQQRQFQNLCNKVSAVTPMSQKFERFIASALRMEPFEREGPTHYCYPGLGSIGYYDDCLFGWLTDLEAASNIIQDEFERVVDAEAAQLVPYINYPAGVPLEQWSILNNNADWTAIHLLQNGRTIEANARHCPQLMKLLATLPQPDIYGAGPNAMFSLLAPGAHIPPHTGISNARLVCHLPIIVPEGCWFRIGKETRLWERGKAWVFDDTIEHEAMNPSGELRVVMICDIWHPMLDATERAGIKAVIEAGGQLHGL